MMLISLFVALQNVIIDDQIGWCIIFFFSSRRRHTRFDCDWSSDVCSSDLVRDCGPQSHIPGEIAGPQRRRKGSRTADCELSWRAARAGNEGSVQEGTAGETGARGAGRDGFRIGIGAGMKKELTRRQYMRSEEHT